MKNLIEEEQNDDKLQFLKWVNSDNDDQNQYEEAQNIQSNLEKFIIENDHPCLMARSVIDSGRYLFGIYDELGTRESASLIYSGLESFLDNNKENSPQEFSSFIAIYKSNSPLNEEEFERKLWQQLQYLHEVDAPLYPWDPKVSSDPNDPYFSFSLRGHAFFLIGLHPNSSRLARKFQYQALVFNLHEQFEVLREMKSFDIVSEKIRQRDEELQGSINPMLTHYGEISEARQYSGREVGDNWKCPFKISSHK